MASGNPDGNLVPVPNQPRQPRNLQVTMTVYIYLGFGLCDFESVSFICNT